MFLAFNCSTSCALSKEVQIKYNVGWNLKAFNQGYSMTFLTVTS